MWRVGRHFGARLLLLNGHNRATGATARADIGHLKCRMLLLLLLLSVG